MNNLARIVIEVPSGIIKSLWNNIFHGTRISIISAISPCAEITINSKAKTVIKDHFRARSGARIRVRSGAELSIGKNVSVNHGCMLVCREKITIGDDVQFSPNVMVYDHDHDFTDEAGVKGMKYVTSPIEIGNNVWIGANTVILRGTHIGDNCVIGAGSVVKGVIEKDSVYYQKKEKIVKKY